MKSVYRVFLVVTVLCFFSLSSAVYGSRIITERGTYDVKIIQKEVHGKTETFEKARSRTEREFEDDLKCLTDPRDVEYMILGRPRILKTENGPKLIFEFILTGTEEMVREVFEELDRLYKDDNEDRN